MQHNSLFYVSAIKQVPIFRFLIAFATGIISQYNAALSFNLVVSVLIASLLFVIAYHLFPINLKFKLKRLQGVAIMLAMLAAGAVFVYTQTAKHQHNNIINLYKGQPLLVALSTNLSASAKSYKAEAKVLGVYEQQQLKPCSGKILIYFKKDSLFNQLQYGNMLLLNTRLSAVQGAGNPASFNYSEYCAYKGIYHQTFVNDSNYHLLATQHSSAFYAVILNLQQNIITILNTYIANKQAAPIAEALLIGFRNNLDIDLVKAYSNIGIVHIIAISGLHIGMLYIWLQKIAQRLNRKQKFLWLQTFIIIGILWLFTLLAGATPSVLRSTITFTCFALAAVLNKKLNPLNILAISAFIILLINPFALWDVGFQLSYAAVLSILLFYKSIKNWFKFTNKLLVVFWDLSAVTLSAQILTLPLVVYHFHQFPTLFFITNIIAVPLSNFILGSLVLVLATSFMPSIATVVGLVAQWLIVVLNKIAIFFNNNPLAYWGNLYINIGQAIILFIVIFCFAFWLSNKNTKALIYALTACIVFLGIRAFYFITYNKQQQLIVYNVPNHTAIDIMVGRKYFFIGADTLRQQGFLQNFHIKPSRILHRSTEAGYINTQPTKNYIIRYKQTAVAVLNKANIPKNFTCNTLIISNNANFKNIVPLVQQLHCSQVVIDANNKMWKIHQWQQQLKVLNLQPHITSVSGAFSLHL